MSSSSAWIATTGVWLSIRWPMLWQTRAPLYVALTGALTAVAIAIRDSQMIGDAPMDPVEWLIVAGSVAFWMMLLLVYDCVRRTPHIFGTRLRLRFLGCMTLVLAFPWVCLTLLIGVEVRQIPSAELPQTQGLLIQSLAMSALVVPYAAFSTLWVSSALFRTRLWAKYGGAAAGFRRRSSKPFDAYLATRWPAWWASKATQMLIALVLVLATFLALGSIGARPDAENNPALAVLLGVVVVPFVLSWLQRTAASITPDARQDVKVMLIHAAIIATFAAVSDAVIDGIWGPEDEYGYFFASYVAFTVGIIQAARVGTIISAFGATLLTLFVEGLVLTLVASATEPASRDVGVVIANVFVIAMTGAALSVAHLWRVRAGLRRTLLGMLLLESIAACWLVGLFEVDAPDPWSLTGVLFLAASLAATAAILASTREARQSLAFAAK